MKGYLIGPWPATKKHQYADLAKRIRQEYPELIGKHVEVQLEALGLAKVFETGSTVGMLPYSFTDMPR